MTESDRDFAELHKSLKKDLARIDRDCASATRGSDQETQVAELRAAIKVLRKKLADHFNFEEQEDGGYMQLVVTARPTLTRKVNRLRADHDAILASLDEIIATPDARQTTDALRSAFVATMRILRRHEAKEMDLVQQAVLDDLGSPD
jgi:hemerythrin